MIDSPPPFPSFFKDSNENLENITPEECIIRARFKRPLEWMGFNEKGDEIQETDEQIWNYVKQTKEAIEETGKIPAHLAILDAAKKQEVTPKKK